MVSVKMNTSNIIGFVLNKEDNRLINDLKEEGITSADILRNSLKFYHNSLFKENISGTKNKIKKNKIENKDDRYIIYLEKEINFWKNKYNSLEKKFQNFINDTIEKLDDSFKLMIANKYDLKNLKGLIKELSPQDQEWISTSKKLDKLFEEKLNQQ